MRTIPPWFGLAVADDLAPARPDPEPSVSVQADAVDAAPPSAARSAVPAPIRQENREIVVLGCPFDGAVSGRAGAADGPAAIRGWAASAEAITEDGSMISGLRVIDVGDVVLPDTPAASETPRVSGTPTDQAQSSRSSDPGASIESGQSASRWQAIEAAADAALRAHPQAFFLGLGGDHGVTPPLLASSARHHPGLGLLLLDAHADCFPDYEGDRASHACAVSRAWDHAGIVPRNTALVGLRSYAQIELASLRQAGWVVSAAEWSRQGVGTTADAIVDVLGGGPVYSSFDIDVLDPSAAPGTGYPVAAGPSSRDVLELLAALWPRLDIFGMDLVEVAPALDPSAITAATAAQVLLQVFGHVAAEPSTTISP